MTMPEQCPYLSDPTGREHPLTGETITIGRALENDVVVTSEIPGVNPDDIDISVTGDTLTIKGKRQQPELKEGQTWQRRERSGGSFYRTIELPFTVDSSKVEADYTKGILKITLPRAESEKPKKISIKAA